MTNPFYIAFDEKQISITPTEKPIGKLSMVEVKYTGKIVSGKEYELSYWDEQSWRPHEQKVAENEKVEFHNIPSGRLYWLKDNTRPFTVQNDSITWW